MSEINIAGAIDKLMIFDDPLPMDYNKYCHRFGYAKVGKKYTTEFSKKCDQCKTAYQKAVGKKIAEEFIEDCENGIDTFGKE